MTAQELDTDRLTAGYRTCARITRRHGTTYFWGALLLEPAQRRHVYAVYALCRMADDIVDDLTERGSESRAAALRAFEQEFTQALDGRTSTDPVISAAAHTVRACGIATPCFDRFFGAMAADLHTDSYATWPDLCGYMEGSAAVIGEMMLPILRPTDRAAFEPARSLGFAFQLTNFLRDVGEDLGRGRVYVPQDDLDRFDADPWARTVDRSWRDLMRFEIARNRELYRQADAGLARLPPRAQRCISTARVLYSKILDVIEDNDFDVFSQRARVPTRTKMLLTGRNLVQRS